MTIANGLAEILESRTLMSVTALSTAVKIDRLHVQVDLLKFQTDCVTNAINYLNDVQAIKKDDLAQATTVVPLVKQLRTDFNQMRVTLAGDRLTEAANVLADESVIVTELKQILADKGNATALKADHAQLLADRVTLQNDMIAGLNARLATRQAAYTTIFNDGQAIITAVQSDPNASPKLAADLQKFITDHTNGMTKVTADIQTLIADRTQLAADLTAAEA